jgi:exopolysaccharide production protein ExoZ
MLRGIAAVAVVVHHFYEPQNMDSVARLGAAGVDLFFVISGFIMANVAAERTAGEFLRDRIWRIYPLWWIAVLPWLFWLPRGPTFIASSLTLWPIYGADFCMPVLMVGWTLSFEMLFYLGTTGAIATRPGVVVALYALLLAGALTTSSAFIHFIGNPMVIEFLLGVLVARLPRSPSLGWLAPLGLVLIAMTSPATGDVESTIGVSFALWRAIQWGIPAALIVWGALSLEHVARHRLFDVPVRIGDASYSIYLFHPIVVFGLGMAWQLRILLAVAAGLVMHQLVERRIVAPRQTSRASQVSTVKVA